MSELAVSTACTTCGTELAATLLVCPACHTLVHRARLGVIAQEAEAATDPAQAVALWREALQLLPPGSRQFDAVAQRIDALTVATQKKEMSSGPAAGSQAAKLLGSLGVAGLLLWKFKFILVALVTKGKLLLLGLTKMSTVATMFLSLGVYWAAWGWKFAAALIAAIYVHEMGHVAELRRRGMAADAPMFIPGFGAFVRLHQHAATPSEDARIGLAGPIWGLGASVAALIAYVTTDMKFWGVIAQITAVINLFNLTPVWQLDGSRGFSALTRKQRWIAVAVIAIAWAATREGMLVLVGLVAGWRAVEKNATRNDDWRSLLTYAALVFAFAALQTIPTLRS